MFLLVIDKYSGKDFEIFQKTINLTLNWICRVGLGGAMLTQVKSIKNKYGL